MAVTTLELLPPALALNGSELVMVDQRAGLATPWVTYSCTTSQIANLLNTTAGAGVCSMRQLVAALASQGALASVIAALPSSSSNAYNIAWAFAYRMSIADPFTTGFLQPTLGYSNTQMTALFVLALTFPV